MRLRRLRLAIVAAVVVLLALPASAQAIGVFDFGVFPETGKRSTAPPNEVFDTQDRPDLTAAGAHPYLNITMSFCPYVFQYGSFGIVCGPQQWEDDLRTIVLGLPPGLLANLQALPTCSVADFSVDGCASDTRIGDVGGYGLKGTAFNANDLAPIGARGSIYNLDTVGSEPARLGAILRPDPGVIGFDTSWQVMAASLRTTGDYGADSTSAEIPRVMPLVSGDMQPIKVVRVNVSLFNEVNGRPLIVNPTSCEPAVATIKVNTYQDPTFVDGPPSVFTPTDCDKVPFTPTAKIKPTDTNRAGAPSAYSAGIEFPDSIDDPVVQSHLKDVEFTLKGATLNPSAGIGLEGCTAEQLGLGTDDPVRCPAASEIGDLTVETPLLPGPLHGKAYFAKPTTPGPATEQHPWQMYTVIEGYGVRIKLQGDVIIDQETGAIRNVFHDLPQAPFTKLELKLKGGDTAPIMNPTTCGTHTLEGKFTGWSGATAESTASFQISGDGQGGPCADPKPFAPTISAAADTLQAASDVKLNLNIRRSPGQQLVKGLDTVLPPGLVGSLASVPLCPLARSVAGSCPEDSKIGSLTTAVGDGARPIALDGSLYLAEPQVPGDPASVSIVVPAKVGPIDLGNVVVTARVIVDPRTAIVTTTTSSIPTRFAGIPQHLRAIEVRLDREGFLRNPTSCSPKQLVANFRSDEGALTSAFYPYQAQGCESLAFTPRLRMIAGGSRALTRKTNPWKNDVHPKLRAIVTQPEGQANIASSRVVLPWILRPNTPRIQRPGALCQDDQVARRACPPLSRVGTATAYSPLIREPLRGPAYIVQQFEESNPLPRLVIFLDGITSVQLESQNRFVGGIDPVQRIRTVNTFESVPDVPVTHFELDMDGGELGLLNNWRDLCKRPDAFEGSFSSQSGRSFSFRRRLEVDGCESKLSLFSILTARMTRSGTVKVRVRCTSKIARCKGRLSLRTASKVRVSKRRKARRRTLTLGARRFSLAAGKRRTVRVKVRKKTLRALRRMKRVRIRIIARVNGQTKRKTARVKVPRRKRSKKRRRG